MNSPMSTRFKVLLALLLSGILAACSTPERGSSWGSEGDAGTVASATTTLASAGPSFDIGAVMRRVHFAFRPMGNAFEGGHSTYGVRVTATGQVRVTPVQHVRTPGKSGDQHGRGLDYRVVRGRPLVLQTVALRCGHRALNADVEVSVAEDGGLAIKHGDVTERLQNSATGVEQSWRFDERPCAGDLLVRVRTSGLSYVGVTRGGLHFANSATGLGLRVGHATWVDARGTKTPVKAEHDGGEIHLRVPAAVVRRSAFPAVLDPVISPELGLDKPLAGPAWGSQARPRVTHDGTNHLVVWQDYRNLGTPSWDIYGARVSAAGKLLDAAGILISSAPGHQQLPQVASGKGTTLVVWHDYRNNATYPDIYGARLSSTGAVLDPKGLAISTAASHQLNPAVTYGGGVFLVAWQDYRKGTYDIFGARITLAGALQDTSGISISTATRHQQRPAVTFGGGNFFIAWDDTRNHPSYPDVYGARLTPTGALLDAAGIPVSVAAYHQSVPAVAFGGSHYFVVWQDYRDYKKSAWDVYGARVAVSGNLQDAKGIPISTAVSNQYSPSVAFDGKGFLAVWQDYRTHPSTKHDIYGARITTAGVVQDTTGLGVSYAAGEQQYPSVAAGGGGFLVVWEDERNATSVRTDVYGARVQPSGALMDPAGLLISSAANNQLAPAVAHDGKNYLVVWQDYRAYTISANDIHGALVTPAGKLLTPSGVTVSTATGDQLTPAVAFAGKRYLVVWQQKGDIHGAQVDATGKLLHPSGVPLCTAGGSQLLPAVAGSPSGYLVLWQDHRASATYADIYGARVNHYGGLADAKALAISAAPYGQQSPAVAFDGTNYFAVWQDARSASISSWDIYGARVSTAGKVLDATGVAISTQLLNQAQPALAWGKAAYLVAWQDDRNKTTSSWDIYGARVSAAGAVLDTSGVALSAATSDETFPAVASNGDGYLVAWQDQRNGKDNPDIYGTAVSGAAVVQSMPAAPLAAMTGSAEVSPAVASVGSKEGYLLVYGRLASQSPLGAHRVFGRTVTPAGKNGVACTSAKGCASGYCADGVCCDKACGAGDPTDCQACSAARGAATDGACGPVKAGRACRAKAGPCDASEACDGAALSCPADNFAKAGTVCRAKLGLCDVAEACTGAAAQCPVDALAKAGTTCRVKSGPCDVAEACTGSAAQCPADTFAPSTAACRAKAGPCDVAEACTGSAAQCPADTFAPAATTCRVSTGICDVAEACTGASAQCPADLFKLPGFVCRKAAGPCDQVETCATGKTTCPPDTLKADGTPCAKGQCKQGACVAVDAGAPDQGADLASPDLALPDTGPEAAPDSAPTVDLGPDRAAAGDQAAPPDSEEGCSCQAAGGNPSLLVMFLVLLLVGRRYRRSR